MVHSALKRKRSSELLSGDVQHRRGDAPPEDRSFSSKDIRVVQESEPPEVDMIWKPLNAVPEDPRPLLLSLLSFLSDAELFTLITHRIAHAAPFKPPLYLTPFCIEGIHNFFMPQHFPTHAFPDNLAGDSPFTKIPSLRDEKGHIIGKVTARATKGRAAAMLVSLATLMNFLKAHELRFLIQARAGASVAPHDGVCWFLEFMTSGGDAVPRGKLDFQRRNAKLPRGQAESRRLRAERLLESKSIKKKNVPVGDSSITESRTNMTLTEGGSGELHPTVDSFLSDDNEQEEGGTSPATSDEEGGQLKGMQTPKTKEPTCPAFTVQ